MRISKTLCFVFTFCKKVATGCNVATALWGSHMLDAAIDEIRELIEQAQNAPENEERIRRVLRQDRIGRLMQRMAKQFGRRHGLYLASRCFTLEQLAARTRSKTVRSRIERGAFNITAHAFFYCDRSGRPAAIAAHLYDWPNAGPEIETSCLTLGLRYEAVIDFPSWWYPGKTQLVLYTAQRERRATIPHQPNLPFPQDGIPQDGGYGY